VCRIVNPERRESLADPENVDIQAIGPNAQRIEQIFLIHPATRRIGNTLRRVGEPVSRQQEQKVMISPAAQIDFLWSAPDENLNVLLVARDQEFQAQIVNGLRQLGLLEGGRARHDTRSAEPKSLPADFEYLFGNERNHGVFALDFPGAVRHSQDGDLRVVRGRKRQHVHLDEQRLPLAVEPDDLRLRGRIVNELPGLIGVAEGHFAPSLQPNGFT